jgi:hypothetical protein
LKEDGVKVWCISPGFLATGVGGERAALARRGLGHPSTGGKLIIAVIKGKKDADVGKIVSGAGIQDFEFRSSFKRCRKYFIYSYNVTARDSGTVESNVELLGIKTCYNKNREQVCPTMYAIIDVIDSIY